jgi:hypothetical protein
MAIEKRVEWTFNVSPENAAQRLHDALVEMGAQIRDGSQLSFEAETPRSVRRNRWSARWRVTAEPADRGSIATLRVDMTGNKHEALLDELAERANDVVIGRTQPPSNWQAVKEQRAERDAEEAERRAEQSAHKTLEGATALPTETRLEVYKVVYRGGLAELPKAKVGGIELVLTPDAFRLSPTNGSRRWWRELTIPYEQVSDVEIVGRVVSTFEGLVGGLNSRQLNQDNNIHFVFTDTLGREVALRVEMLSGVTVMGQAKKCREFEDRLRTLGIRRRFKGCDPIVAEPSSELDIPQQIMQLAVLRDQGILTVDEFDSKKLELLSRL